MKKRMLILAEILIAYSCNYSDTLEKLPMGYEVIYEGGNQNRLLKENQIIIDSGLVECRFEHGYLIVSIDSTYSMNPKNVSKKNLIYFIQDMGEDTVMKQISYTDLQKIIKEKSLENR